MAAQAQEVTTNVDTIIEGCSLQKNVGGLKILWQSAPRNILIVHKFCDVAVIESLKEFIQYLLRHFSIRLFIEAATLREVNKDAEFCHSVEPYLLARTELNADDCVSDISVNNEGSCLLVFNPASDSHKKAIDLVICLGGDGTLLHLSSIFQSAAPPVLAFRLGTISFLTPFQFSTYPHQLDRVFQGSFPCILRTRLRCHIIRNGLSVPGTSPITVNAVGTSSHSGDVKPRSSSPEGEYHFLNEVVISRGMVPSLCELVIKVYGKEVTHIRGDGLIISTPTGSTAYSMAAGSSMLHPCVSGLIITPINSMSLSSRALVVPAHAQLSISLCPNARASSVHVSCDGHPQQTNFLRRGDVLSVTASPYPLPCLCSENQLVDWFCDLAQCLNWNTRGHPCATKLSHHDSTEICHL